MNQTCPETLGCREALASVTYLSCASANVIIYSDCKGIVEDIQNKRGGRYGTIIREIDAMAMEFTSCSFIHEGRSTNKEAHCLAKHALGLDSRRPSSLAHLSTH